MRTLIDIPENLLAQVDELAQRENISRAEAVRRAMKEYVDQRRAPRPDAAFGIWKARRIDALESEESLRREWER